MNGAGQGGPNARAAAAGAACPRTLIAAFQDELGIEIRQILGMAEMSPLGTIATLKAGHRMLPAEE